MASKVPLLDEQDFNVPPLLQALEGQDINAANNLCWYFHSSQFFEPRCNNSAILNAHVNDPATNWILHNRKEFEQRMKTIDGGTRFVVAGEPQGEGQPWLYQRQNSVRNAEGQLESFVEGNWYNQGTRILMAPSMLDVVRARLLTVSTRLQQVAEITQNMTHWSPATGHSYFPPTFDAPKAAATASRIGSPTLAPTEPDASQTTATAPAADPMASTAETSEALLMQSLNLTNTYGDEYMNDNPLLGEPGAFVFSNTKSAVDARNKASEQATQAVQPPQVAAAKSAIPPLSVAPSVAATPKGASTPAAMDAQSRKGSTVGQPKDKKRERRKSKGLASPTTPGPSIPPAS